MTCISMYNYGMFSVRSYEPPKRDEEKEIERKARAKRARESRRSTQVRDNYPVISNYNATTSLPNPPLTLFRSYSLIYPGSSLECIYLFSWNLHKIDVNISLTTFCAVFPPLDVALSGKEPHIPWTMFNTPFPPLSPVQPRNRFPIFKIYLWSLIVV